MVGTETNITNYGANTAERLGLAQLYSKRVAPTSAWSDMGGDEHFVQFYEDDNYIVSSIAEYVIHGLRSGETCIVAATGEHLAAVENIINSFTSGLEAARSEGKYIPLNAVDTLSKFMVGKTPDAKLFSSVIGEIMANAAKRGHRIRVFGEMVGVLCCEGNYAGAIALEKLWNELREEYPFSLFCAYSMDGLNNSSATDNMAHICDGHSRVIPNESYTSLTNSSDRLKAIAVLQQRSKQLEAEVAELERRITLKQSTLQAA